VSTLSSSAQSTSFATSISANKNIMPAGDATLDREWSVLLAACSLSSCEEKCARLRTLLSGSVNWTALLSLGEHHGVLPLLHQALREIDSVRSEHMCVLQQAQQTNLHKTLLLSRELIRIVEHLSALGIEAIPYKGPALAESLYGDIALRQSGDIDLLIRARDLPRIRDTVRELGYTPHATLSEIEERAYLKSGYEYSFDGPGGPNLLEVQWRILPRFYSVNFDIEGLFERAIPVSVAGQSMKSLSYEDLLLVLSVHAAKHVWGRLIWLCDLARLMTLPLNWDWMKSQAGALGILRIVRVTMTLANRLLGAECPRSAQDGFPDDPVAMQLVEEIQKQMPNNSAYGIESLAYFRLMMRLRERRSDRMRFLRRLVFTPGPGEWKAVRLPAPLFPLYRLVRLTRLAKRIARVEPND
jgi:hypothetical protein